MSSLLATSLIFSLLKKMKEPTNNIAGKSIMKNIVETILIGHCFKLRIKYKNIPPKISKYKGKIIITKELSIPGVPAHSPIVTEALGKIKAIYPNQISANTKLCIKSCVLVDFCLNLCFIKFIQGLRKVTVNGRKKYLQRVELK